MATNYYDRFIPVYLMRELKKRVEMRIREELLPLANKIIAEEVANSALNLSEWIYTTDAGRNLSIVIQQPERKSADI